MYIDKKDIFKMPRYTDAIRRQGRILYKMCDTIHFTSENFLKYLTQMPRIPNTILPKDIIRDETGIYGTITYRIYNSQNLEEFLDNPKFEIDLIDTIKKLTIALNALHEHIIVGDVRNANILLTKNNPYFIDFESSDFKKGSRFLAVYYSVRTENLIIPDNQLADSIKFFISLLCIYYNCDLEYLFKSSTLNDLLSLLINIDANKHLIFYLRTLIADANKNLDAASTNLLEIVNLLTPPSETEKNRLIRTLS